MKMRNTVFRFVLYFNWIFFVIGIECPSCEYMTTVNAEPANIREIIENIPNNDPKCATNINGQQNQTKMRSCDEVPGKKPLCEHYSARATLNIKSLTVITIPLNITYRDCYNFTKSAMPQIGCMNRTNDADDIKKLTKRVSAVARNNNVSTGFTVESLIGELCLYADTTTTVTPKNLAKALFRKDQFIGFILFLVYCCMFLF